MPASTIRYLHRHPTITGDSLPLIVRKGDLITSSLDAHKVSLRGEVAVAQLR